MLLALAELALEQDEMVRAAALLDEAVDIARAGGLSAEQAAVLERWHAALALFRERRWIDARNDMTVLAAEPGYQRLCSIYLGYIRELLANPPGPEWDAAFTLYEK